MNCRQRRVRIGRRLIASRLYGSKTARDCDADDYGLVYNRLSSLPSDAGRGAPYGVGSWLSGGCPVKGSAERLVLYTTQGLHAEWRR